MSPLRRFNNSWGNFFWSIDEDNHLGLSQSYIFDGNTHNYCFAKGILWKGIDILPRLKPGDSHSNLNERFLAQ
jgi:hypothetical protein